MRVKLRPVILIQLRTEELRSITEILVPSYAEVKTLEHYGTLYGGMGGEKWEWNENFYRAHKYTLLDIYNKINEYYRVL
jgi:hypothetical protein